jgi:hypothetical protein
VQHAVVDVSDPRARSAISAALEAIGVPWCTRENATEDPLVVVQSPSSTPEPSTAPLVRVWSCGRGVGAENPFGDRRTRHVLGLSPTIDLEHLRSTLSQVSSRSLIHLPEVLGDGARVVGRTVTSSAQAEDLLREAESFFGSTPCPERLRTVLSTALIELVTNAIYNAPVKNGVRPFAASARSEVVVCEKPVFVQFAVDQVYAAVAVQDGYGSLFPEEVIDNLFRCHQFNERQIDSKQGGAGLGLFMLLQNASRVIYNFFPGRFTEIIMLRRHSERFADFAKSAPTLNLCLSNQATNIDKRRHRRHPVSWPAVCIVNGLPVPARVMDVSTKGAFVRLDDESVTIPNDQLVQLSIVGDLVPTEGRDAPGWSFAFENLPLRADAVVRWTCSNRRHNCNGVGVEFRQNVPGIEQMVSGDDDDERTGGDEQGATPPKANKDDDII